MEINSTTALPSLADEPNLIERFKKDIELAGLVGEQINAVIAFLCAVSAGLSKPLHLTVQGSSSAGKNQLLGSVAKFIPDERKKYLTGMSPKVLMYSQPDEFVHKAVFIEEYDGVSGADYATRVFQSAGKIEYEYVSSTGDGIQKNKNVVNGPAAFLQATTKPLLHPENETRLVFIQMDESSEQTREILRQQAITAATGNIDRQEDLFAPWHELILSFKFCRIIIPFAVQLVESFPTDQVRARRDFPKFLAVIEASAYLHQHQRQKEGDAVLANECDYRIARELFLYAYSIGPEKTVSELLKAAENLTRVSGDFAVLDLQEKTGWGKSKTYDVLKRAEDFGYIAAMERRGRYRLLRSSAEPSLNLPETVTGKLVEREVIKEETGADKKKNAMEAVKAALKKMGYSLKDVFGDKK